jgi:spore maturation protein CgeB
MKKILVAGNWRAYIHEEAISKAFEELGCDVIRFKWGRYFTHKKRNFLWKLYARLEYRFAYGFIVSSINKDLIRLAIQHSPDFLFVYRPILISKRTLNEIKSASPRTIIASYNNDDPFSSNYSQLYWLKYRRSIASYDVIFSYRPSNMQQYKDWGAENVKLLPPWFIKSKNFPIELKTNEIIKYKSDVVFIGHYENDGRIEVIKELVKSGFDVALYGPEWNKIVIKDDVLKVFFPVKYLSDDEYSKALCGSKIAIALYSSLNNDVYTRKCFEIPATGTMMIAQRTKEMLKLFQEDVECAYFSNTQELLEKVGLYVGNDGLREKIAKNGYNRAIGSGYDVIGRASHILESL